MKRKYPRFYGGTVGPDGTLYDARSPPGWGQRQPVNPDRTKAKAARAARKKARRAKR